MSWAAMRLEKELKRYDRKLYVVKSSNGMLQVWRKPESWGDSMRDESTDGAQLSPLLVLPLTHDWTLKGRIVDWGFEPIKAKLREMDGWRDDTMLEKWRNDRDFIKRDEDRMKRNDARARAAELRSDFAKATNDINTSTLEKIDNRRLKNGNC